MKPVFLAAQSPADPGSAEDDSKRNTDEGIDESSPEENEHTIGKQEHSMKDIF